MKNRIKLRPVKFSDAKDIFELSNDSLVRKNSFSQNKIEWHKHLEWLKSKIKHRNHLFLVVESAGKFIGQTRFSIDTTEAIFKN